MKTVSDADLATTPEVINALAALRDDAVKKAKEELAKCNAIIRPKSELKPELERLEAQVAKNTYLDALAALPKLEALYQTLVEHKRVFDAVDKELAACKAIMIPNSAYMQEMVEIEALMASNTFSNAQLALLMIINPLCFTGHTEFVSSVAFSPDGEVLATGSGKTAKLWGLPQVKNSARSRGIQILFIQSRSALMGKCWRPAVMITPPK